MVSDRRNGGYRRYVPAVVGCLIFSSLAAQTPNPAGTASPGPAIESQRSGETGEYQSTAPPSLALGGGFEDPIEAERARDREDRAEQHDAYDLKAQQDAAGSDEDEDGATEAAPSEEIESGDEPRSAKTNGLDPLHLQQGAMWSRAGGT